MKNKIIFQNKNITKFLIESDKYGQFIVIVDSKNIELIRKYKWSIEVKNNHPTAIRSSYAFKKSPIYLHRLITGFDKTDHINGDIFNNREYNLRKCTDSENTKNKKIRRDNKTGYKGVSFWKNKYIARICVNYKSIYIGSYNTKEEAALAYNKKATEQFGKFARLNNVR